MQNYPNVTFNTDRAKEFFLDKISYTIGPVELEKMIDAELNHINIIDLRSYQDYINGHIPFAEHLPTEQLEEHLNMLEKDKINILYCYNEYCHLAEKNAVILAEKGYPIMVLCGGFHAWKNFFNFDVISNNSTQDREEDI